MKKYRLGLFVTMISLCWAYHQPSDLSMEAAKQRMSPPSQLVVSGAQVGSAKPVESEAPGQGIYKKFCHVCHSSGIAGAPKVGNHDQWLARYQEGWPVMMKRAMSGYKGMPAKGHCVKCNEDQIHEAIEYMLGLSGIESEKH
jgi:cytochrome c5